MDDSTPDADGPSRFSEEEIEAALDEIEERIARGDKQPKPARLIPGRRIWNYRVVRIPSAATESKFEHVIFEVHYAEDGQINGWEASGPRTPRGETAGELEINLELMLRAHGHPVLQLIDNRLVPVR